VALAQAGSPQPKGVRAKARDLIGKVTLSGLMVCKPPPDTRTRTVK
jgi:hypothetical protein